ncbi:hypothetical protein CYFUS_001251 [Cystobacter fuscus]|uniref:Uncharacterized protein n=1 Tax=Cystobacter fuscus TaxID=43 RepID=A0A250IX96_9BACT|nr:hypothetical protein [Cystobacter fuscus]ATB35837.1 hypothetical protein CYFUS_001251 [Cystobacter fuscus]
MDFDKLEAAWRSPANTPDDRAQAYLMEELMRTLKARRRRELLFYAIPATAMTIFTAITVQAIAAGRMDVGREWASLVMLAMCWLVLAAVLVVGFLLRSRGRSGGSPVRDTLTTMLVANRRARANVKIFWMMLPVFLAPMLVGVQQLREVGKATDRDAWQMLFVFGVALVASVGWNTARYVWVLKPEQRRLEALLAEYEA